MNDQQARQTPITDLLRDIPADARMVYEVTPTHHQSIPVGVLAKNAADEIERLRAERDELRRKLDEMRAALIAAMEIVQRERVRIAYNAKGAPPTIEIGYADILRRLDAVIAQADAALGNKQQEG